MMEAVECFVSFQYLQDQTSHMAILFEVDDQFHLSSTRSWFHQFYIILNHQMALSLALKIYHLSV